MEEMNGKHAVKEEEKKKGQAYSSTDQELIRLLMKSRKEQKSELEYEDLEGYELPPRTQFSMLQKPAVSIKYGQMTFNMASIRMFENIEFILPLVHVEKKKMTIVMCPEEEASSVAWARKRSRDGKWVNRDITSEDFLDKIYKMMNWKRECRYKVMGKVSNSQEGLVLVFELDEAIMFAPSPMEFKDEVTGEVKKKQVKYYPDQYKDRIGKSYNDYVAAKQITMFEYLDEYIGKTYSDMPKQQEKGASSVDMEKSAGKQADSPTEISPVRLPSGTDMPVAGLDTATAGYMAISAPTERQEKVVTANDDSVRSSMPGQTGAGYAFWRKGVTDSDG